MKSAVVKTARFLEKNKIDYFVLGGVAVGLLGEPRFTEDLDLDLFISKTQVDNFLTKATKAGFKLKRALCLSRAENFGSFSVVVGDVRVDFILASTDFEKEVLERKKRLFLYGQPLWFPSPEDLILLKVIPGRPKDLIDAESVALRHRGKLDSNYLKKWAQKICDEAEDFRVMKAIERLLKL